MNSPDQSVSSGDTNTDAETSGGTLSSEPVENSFDPQLFLKTVTQRPGVYQMLNAQGDTIYVGKAGNLKKRVSSYFQKDPGSAKTIRNSHGYLTGVVVKNRKARRSVLIHMLVRLRSLCAIFRNYLRFASVKILILKTARVRVCSIKSIAVPHLALG